MRVEVTRDDMAFAQRKSTVCCPVANAVSRILCKPIGSVRVGGGRVFVGPWWEEEVGRLPVEVQVAMQVYDSGGDFPDMIFDLDLSRIPYRSL